MFKHLLVTAFLCIATILFTLLAGLNACFVPKDIVGTLILSVISIATSGTSWIYFMTKPHTMRSGRINSTENDTHEAMASFGLKSWY